MKRIGVVCRRNALLAELLATKISGCLLTEDVAGADAVILDESAVAWIPQVPVIYLTRDAGDERVGMAQYVLLKPFSARALEKAVQGLVMDKTEIMEARVRPVLNSMGMQESHKGFGYAARAVAIELVDGEKTVKELNELVAAAYGVKPAAVERAIRTAVEYTFKNGDIAMMYGVFGNTVDPDKGKPTNGEFIAILAERMRGEI